MTSPARRTAIRTNSLTFVFAANFALSILFAALVMEHGIPALRQDWNWPFAPLETQRFIIDTWSGWDAKGIGAPAAYPSSYILAVPLGLLMNFVGPHAALFLFLVATGLMVTWGAHALAYRGASAPLVALAVAGFALFNPWVYVKVVAGHVVMVLAYGATMLFIAEISRPKPRWHTLMLSLAVIFAQIQFFIIAVILLWLRFRERNVRLTLGLGFIIALPTVCGIVANWSSLSGIPYTLEWQRSQSVALTDAPFLVGYFAGYAAPVAQIFRVSVLLFGCAAIAGLYTAIRSGVYARYAILWSIVGIIFCLLAAGTKGPLGTPYAFAVSHVPATAVYRELFDLLGYVAMAYVALAATNKVRALHVLTACAGSAAIAAWLIVPPAHYFVNRNSIPNLQLAAPENSRYALIPAFQPMSFNASGSGEDPNAFTRHRNVTPLNVYLASGAEAAAFASYLRTGSTSMLASLSVSTIVNRPWLKSDMRSLQDQLGAGFSNAEERRTGIAAIKFLPELAIQDSPLLASVPPRLGDGNMFWADSTVAAGHAASFRPVSAPNESANASVGWVPAALTFIAHPEAFQAIGGAATNSGYATLHLRHAKFLLVFAQGKLKSNADVIAQNTNGYRWVSAGGAIVLGLTCSGYCVVAGYSDTIPVLPARPAPRFYRQVAFNQMTPWLLSADLPPTRLTTMRYNTRYNSWWFAYVDGHSEQHVRLDSLINGWLIGASAARRHVILINVASALQLLLEIFGIMAICAVATRAALKGRFHHDPA